MMDVTPVSYTHLDVYKRQFVYTHISYVAYTNKLKQITVARTQTHKSFWNEHSSKS